MSVTSSKLSARGRWAAVAALVAAVVGVGVLWLVPTTAAGSDGSSVSLFSLVGQWGLESILTVASVLLIVLTSVAVAVGGSAHVFAVRVVCAVALVGLAVFLAVGLDRALVSSTLLAVVFGVPAVLVVVSAVQSRSPGTSGAVAPAH